MAEPDGRVVVEITGDDSSLQNALNSANQSVRNSSAQISQAMNSAASSVSGVNNALGSVSSAAANASSAVSGAASGTQTASSAAADYSGTLAQLQAVMSQCAASLGSMDSTLTEVADGMNSAGESAEQTDGIMQKLGGTLKTVFSIAMIKEFAQAVYDVGSAYEYSLSKVQSIADTTAVSIDQISDDVIALSSKMGTSAADINEAVYQAISAGVDTADAVSTVEVAVKSAKAGFTDTATAVDGLTTVMNSFKTANLEADEVANKFLITQNLGKTSFGELAATIGNVAPTANAAGVSIDELLASVAALTANGINTSSAMTGVKAALSNIITPSSNAKKMAEELGIQFDAAALKSKGFSQFMKEIAEATEGDTAKMSQLFGSVEALNTMLTLTSEGGAALFDKTMSEMATNTTALDTAYETMTDNLTAKTDILKTAAENFGIDIYQSISGGLSDAVGTITDYVNRLHDAFMNGGISELGGELFRIAFDAVSELGQGIADALPELVPEALKTVTTIAGTITDNIDTVIDTAGTIINSFADALTSEETLSYLFEKTPEILTKLDQSLVDAVPDIIDFAIEFCDTVALNLENYDWTETSDEIFNNLANSLFMRISAGGGLTQMAFTAAQEKLDAVTEGYSTTLGLSDFIGGSNMPQSGQNLYTGSFDTFDDSILLAAQSTEEAAESFADSEETIGETVDKVSEEFSSFYEGLETELVHGNIDTEEFNRRLEEKLNSSAEYLAPCYNKFWKKLGKVNETAEKNAKEKVSDDFQDYYDNQKLLLAMGEENGGISEETFYTNLENKLNSISDSRTNTAYTPFWNALNNWSENQSRQAEKESKQVSEEFKTAYDKLKLLKAKGEENGGISENEYYKRLYDLLTSSEEYNSETYTSFWQEYGNFSDKKEREREQAQEKNNKKELDNQKKAAQRELSQLKSNISELQSEYKENLTKLISERDKFKDKLSANILSTSEESVTDKRTGQTIKKKTDTVADIQKKIDARKRLGAALKNLVEKKNLPKGLLSELAGMDPEDALRFAEQLDKMDPLKYDNIVTAYNEYEEINKEIADNIYGPQIKELNEQFSSDLTGLLDGVSGEAAQKGAEMISAFISGIDISSDDAMEQIKKFADDTVAQLNNAVSDSELVGGKMTLALDNVDGAGAGEDIADQIADGIENNSDAISSAVENAVSNGMSDIKAAVDVKTSAVYSNVSASVPSSRTASPSEQPVREIHTEKIIYRDCKLVWKDGRALAEIVDSENKKIGIQGGST